MGDRDTKIIGNGALVKFLEKMADEGNMPAAFLLTGPSMVGKTTILEAIAQKLICEKKSVCGLCPGCKIGIRNHPDILRLGASEEESLRKGINALLKRIHEKPVLSKKLIVFLENIDEFYWATSPLLLKVLEDAPAFVVFLLTAENAEAVLPTIRSRCMVRSAAPLSTIELEKQLIEYLSGRGAGEKNDVHLINKVVSFAGGRPGLAIRLMEDGILREKYVHWYKMLTQMSVLSVAERSQFADVIDKASEGIEVMSLLQSMLRDQIYRQVTENRAAPDNTKNFLGTMRRSREATAMFKASVPPRLVLEYVFFNQ